MLWQWWTKLTGLRELLPEGPALGAEERKRGWGQLEPSGAAYRTQPTHGAPVLPLQVWGMAYSLDVVIVSRHPRWNMHEYAMALAPDGPLWLMNDTTEPDRAQSIVADFEGVETWMPEVPVARRRARVEVDDRSTADMLDLRIAYDNLDGEAVTVAYQGPRPHTAQAKRNGCTMGHSAEAVNVALDIPFRDFGTGSTMQIGGEPVAVRRILGLIPFRMALVQSQGGFAVADTTQRATPEGLRVDYRLGERVVPTPWIMHRDEDGVRAVQQEPFRTLQHRFDRVGERLELRELRVTQFAREHPTARVLLNPALPDLRCRFEGEVRCRYVLDINGQEGHAVGHLLARWGEHGPEIDLCPEAPWWTRDRPMRTTVRFDGDVARVQTVRVESTAP